MDALSPSSRPKVLVVDDDEAVRDSLKVLLEVQGIEVEDHESAAGFVRHYRKPRRGCAILDQHRPVLTGVDFLSTPEGRRLGLPIIPITGRGDPELEKRARAAGVAEYLQKPVSERVTARQGCPTW
jgi:two-component system response regulator FixJ